MPQNVTLNGWVGVRRASGQNCENQSIDMISVAELLGGISPNQGGHGGPMPLPPLRDGVLPPVLEQAILTFQQANPRLCQGWVDRLVSPTGATLRAMNQLCTGRVKPKHDEADNQLWAYIGVEYAPALANPDWNDFTLQIRRVYANEHKALPWRSEFQVDRDLDRHGKVLLATTTNDFGRATAKVPAWVFDPTLVPQGVTGVMRLTVLRAVPNPIAAEQGTEQWWGLMSLSLQASDRPDFFRMIDQTVFGFGGGLSDRLMRGPIAVEGFVHRGSTIGGDDSPGPTWASLPSDPALKRAVRR